MAKKGDKVIFNKIDECYLTSDSSKPLIDGKEYTITGLCGDDDDVYHGWYDLSDGISMVNDNHIAVI